MSRAINLRPDACLIGGEWVRSPQVSEVRNPANDEFIATVPVLDATTVTMAIASAQEALPQWSSRTAEQRADVLLRLHLLLLEHEEELSRLVTAEQGKPAREALDEVRYAASFVRWFAEEARRTYGEVVPAHRDDCRLLVLKRPIGVVAAITPWNFPAAMVTRKIAPALAAGCTVILKPAEQTPLTALAIGALAQAAGVPAGVFNIVTGDPKTIGAVLIDSDVVRKLTFTGSTATGASLYARCAPTVKKLGLELGGNAPFIVFDDADLGAAIKGAIASKFRNAGQTCVCANRFLVQDGIYDRFVEAFAAAAAALTVGRGDDPETQVGPLIDDQAAAKVEAHIADAVAGGARIVCGGGSTALGRRFKQPTVLADVDPSMRIYREETFGPVAPVLRFADEAEAIALANDTPFGLAAYAYTSDIGRAWRLAEMIESGMLGINTGLISTAVAPFGGVKSSGLGREGSHHGLDDFLELRTVCLGI